jgi:radial spoke head protein 4A
MMLEWAGVDFGEDNIFYLQKSLKRLAILSGASKLQFFGKIYGTQKDYWVVQGILGFQEEEPMSRLTEPRGKGANSAVFWVTESLLSDWIQLPDVTPEMLVVSRLIKHVFTGNLNSSIISNPPFPYRERHLLRAQLARIQHATEICPKGMFEVDEETNEVKLAEETPDMSTEAMKSLENWAHMQPNILKVGRCSHMAPANLNEEQVEEYMGKMAEEDKVEDRFRALMEDTPVGSSESAWVSKVSGDTQQYNKGEGTITYAVNVIRSLRWPGAVTVAKNG